MQCIHAKQTTKTEQLITLGETKSYPRKEKIIESHIGVLRIFTLSTVVRLLTIDLTKC